MITTKSIGMDEANPKPVRHINWFGQPMEEGDNYWGESKPQEEVPQPQEASKPRVKRVKRSWTAAQIEAMRARMANARAAAKARRDAKLSAPEVEAQNQ